MNRIQELRKRDGVSLAKLSKTLKDNYSITASPQTIMRYEQEKTQPKLDVFESIANHFNVSVPYLQGLSDDPVDLKSWEEATGYSSDQILSELKQLKDSGRSTGNIQNDIGSVVAKLDRLPSGYGVDSAISYVEYELIQLRSDIENKYFIDPEKKEKLKALNNGLNVRPKDPQKELYYDDVDPKILDYIDNVLIETGRIISNGTNIIKNEYNGQNMILLKESIKRLQDLIESLPNKSDD
ncbi:helix-turn-helix domain-containing protein [Leuconostoc suionicum]|uniref:helix-turn-helix domain-containing protein n=1 Tax=Leuconostoc suionicum TaxID=1511761 RepID=UPI003C6B1DC2